MNVNSIAKQVLKPEQMRKIALSSAKVTAPVTKLAHRVGPEVLTGVGIAGGITAAVLAARATLKLEPIIDQMHDDIHTAEKSGTLVTTEGEPVYSAKVVKSTINKVKIRGALDITKLYLPSVSVGALSILCVLGAHGIMRQRNVTLVAALAATEKSFEAYRKKVIDEFGEDKDRDIRFGFEDKTSKNSEGEEVTVTHLSKNASSLYARTFSPLNPNWQSHASYNSLFITTQQQYHNDMLNARGHVFLNDVYDSLGIDRTPEGAVTGWLRKDNKHAKDGFVEIDMIDLDADRRRSYGRELEKTILLDFNVDGVIWDKI